MVARKQFYLSNSINELEMWQAETFDLKRIDEELDWAESIGMKTVCFSTICHGKVIPIATRGAQISFSQLPLKMASDRCLYCSTRVGTPILRPARNTRRFPECITRAGSESRSSRAHGCNQYPRLKAYVQGVIGKFGNDPRVLAWNVWNEPSNRNESSYGNQELKDKERYVEILLPQVFEWALTANPSQPLTSGMWDFRYENDQHHNTAHPT